MGPNEKYTLIGHYFRQVFMSFFSSSVLSSSPLFSSPLLISPYLTLSLLISFSYLTPIYQPHLKHLSQFIANVALGATDSHGRSIMHVTAFFGEPAICKMFVELGTQAKNCMLGRGKREEGRGERGEGRWRRSKDIHGKKEMFNIVMIHCR